MEAPHIELLSAMASLLEGGKYSDLTIVCGQKKFAVHRALVCSRSGFFDGACSHSFKEANSGVIDLAEDDEEAVKHMIDYFYRLDYLTKHRSRSSSQLSHHRTSQSNRRRRASSLKQQLAMIEDPLLACAGTSEEARRDSGIAQPLTPPDEDSSKQLSLSPQVPSSPGSAPDEGEQCELEVEPSENVSATDEPNMVIHAKVYAIADKYDIPGLKDLAKGKFEAQVSKHWDCVEFSDALEEVYCSTVDGNRGLRDIVLQAFRENPRLVMKPEVESAVRDLAPLAFDLYKIASGLPV